MKASNLTTPRSLGDCQFIPSMDPIERPGRTAADFPLWSVTALLLVILFVTFAAATGVPL